MRLHAVIPGLWISGKPSDPLSVRDAETLEEHGIRLVINLRLRRDPEYPSGITAFHRPLSDGQMTAANTAAAEEAATAAQREMRLGRNVLIHCNAGRNRAALVAALVLHGLNEWPGAYCIRIVRQARPGALANEHFLWHLAQLPGRKEIPW